MDVVVNYAAGEEAVGPFFSCEGGKGKRPIDEDGTPSRGLKKNKKKQKVRQYKQENFDDDLVAAMERKKPRGPQMEVFSTRCSKSHALTIREAPTTSSRTVVC